MFETLHGSHQTVMCQLHTYIKIWVTVTKQHLRQWNILHPINPSATYQPFNEQKLFIATYKCRCPCIGFLCDSSPNVLIIIKCNLATFYICFYCKYTEIHRQRSVLFLNFERNFTSKRIKGACIIHKIPRETWFNFLPLIHIL